MAGKVAAFGQKMPMNGNAWQKHGALNFADSSSRNLFF
jgi:hypothetical protein